MTLQAISGAGQLWVPGRNALADGAYVPRVRDLVLDAAAEKSHMVGHVWLPGRTGSKTISSAGGKIHLGIGALTWANAATNLKVGVQAVDAAAANASGDGTYLVEATYIPGTDALSATTVNAFVMDSGSTSLSHGQLISVTATLSARGGADSVAVQAVSDQGNVGYTFPTVSLFTSSLAIQTYMPWVIIEFDDGTFGFIEGGFVSSTGAGWATVAFGSGSTPDEYANIFQVPYSCIIDSLEAHVQPASNAADFELILYSDPLGTPAVIETLTFDANKVGNLGGHRAVRGVLTTTRTLTINTAYAVAVRPTTAGTVTIPYHDVAATGWWAGHGVGANCYSGTRTNQTGAFSGTTTRRLMGVGARISSLDDGAGGGGGGALITGRLVA